MGDYGVCICANCNPNQERGGQPAVANVDTILCASCQTSPECRSATERKFQVEDIVN